MGIDKDTRRAAARYLFEEFGAPLSQLSLCYGVQEQSLKSVAAKHNWQAGHSTRSMKNQLLNIFDAQVSIVKSSADEAAKAAALASMVKTLEGFASVDMKLAAAEKKHDSGDRLDKKDTLPNDVEPDAADHATATERLSSLIKKLSQ